MVAGWTYACNSASLAPSVDIPQHVWQLPLVSVYTPLKTGNSGCDNKPRRWACRVCATFLLDLPWNGKIYPGKKVEERPHQRRWYSIGNFIPPSSVELYFIFLELLDFEIKSQVHRSFLFHHHSLSSSTSFKFRIELTVRKMHLSDWSSVSHHSLSSSTSFKFRIELTVRKMHLPDWSSVSHFCSTVAPNNHNKTKGIKKMTAYFSKK